MTGHEPPPELKEDAHRKPIFARSCRSAQSGCPTAPREVHLPLLPHGPSGVHRHLPRRTRLRRSAGPEENRPVPLISSERYYFTPSADGCQLFSILDLGVAHINVWPYTLHPGQRHTTIIRKAICVDHNQVNECPDAEAPEGEQLKNTADNAPRVKAMHAQKTNEKTQQYRCNPTSISPHHRLMVER